MPSFSYTTGFLMLLVCMWYVVKRTFLSKQSKAPLPPGPRPLPLIGNIQDLPPQGKPEWLHWLKFKDQYGPISSVTALGQTMIVLHDPEAAMDLMKKRSVNYSARPRLEFGNDMCGWKDILASLPNGPRHRQSRRYAYDVLGTKMAVSKFHPLQDVEVRRFLLRTLNEPTDVLQHIRTEAGAVILKVIYDYTIEPHERDPLVDLADAAVAQFAVATMPGSWMVDIMPWLKYMPDWLPGTSFKRTARLWHKTLLDLVERPYAFVKEQMANNSHQPSFLSTLLEHHQDMTSENEFTIKYIAASLYAGGADTTASTLSSFFLAMMLFPEVQKKAQEEIDRVVTNSRLPNFEDRQNLPYVEAIVTEALRWHPVAPIGLPHTAEQNDVYRGYFIPKGASIVSNVWWFLHNPEVYREPMKFSPERFLGETPEPDPRNFVFGYGRRICPGRVLADSAVYLNIAQSLAVFNICKPMDENGNVIEAKTEFTPGILSHPVPFECSTTPRSHEHEQLIRSVEVEHPWEASDAKAFDRV